MSSLQDSLENYKQPVLIFTMKLSGDNSLESGRLALCDYKLGQNDKFIWRATSGSVGNQGEGDIDVRAKGALPPPYRTSLKHYDVSTRYATSPEKGIEGRYFFIVPEYININGVQRSMMRIHLDANVPGTAGCIGVSNKSAFDYFVTCMDILKQWHSKIPLWVIYPFD